MSDALIGQLSNPVRYNKNFMTWLNLISLATSDEEFNPIIHKMHYVILKI